MQNTGGTPPPPASNIFFSTINACTTAGAAHNFSAAPVYTGSTSLSPINMMSRRSTIPAPHRHRAHRISCAVSAHTHARATPQLGSVIPSAGRICIPRSSSPATWWHLGRREDLLRRRPEGLARHEGLVDHAAEGEHRKPAVFQLGHLQALARRRVLAELERVEAQVTRGAAVREHVHHRVLALHAQKGREAAGEAAEGEKNG